MTIFANLNGAVAARNTYPIESIVPRRLPVDTSPACTCTDVSRGCHLHGPQPRERSVPCRHCHDDTWSLDAICDRCHLGWTLRAVPPARTAELGLPAARPGRSRRPRSTDEAWSAKAS